MSNPFSSLESQQNFIPLSTAAAMTKRYRENRPLMLKPAYNLDVLTLSETFGRSGFDSLLAKGECVGIRIYYGMDEELKMHAIVVAVNKDGEDILNISSSQNSTLQGEGGDVLDDAIRCPTICPPSSPLNE